VTSVAIATCTAFPELEEDDQQLLEALTRLGVDARPEIWTDGAVDWAAYDVVLVRSTWDYSDHRDAFVAWCEKVDAITRLVNPAPLIAWNTDKTYLRELAAAGIPVVPTIFLGTPEQLADWVAPADCDTFVVKPTVSAGSRDTLRHRRDADGIDAAHAHIADLIARGKTAMVQPYFDSVDALGETAQMFIAGEYSHAIRKGPMLAIGTDGERVGGLYLREQIEPRTPTDDEREVAERIIAAIPGGAPLYARVDLIRMADGSPVLLELELCEPSLFFLHGAGSAQRLADAIVRL
jgi:glutathione synthase/RimK-type ligase-like ATP-grasp enzyme